MIFFCLFEQNVHHILLMKRKVNIQYKELQFEPSAFLIYKVTQICLKVWKHSIIYN